MLVINLLCHSQVKQTVMTSVYGVTFVGARDQIHRRLNEQVRRPDFREVDLFQYTLSTCAYAGRHWRG
eukprot:COSAG01_NODE_1936_length_8861_cov_27.526364_10_plen_68_part_00